MPRIVIPGARTASGQRKRALPPWLKGRASIYNDPTDDLVTGTIPADLTGAGAFTLRARLRSRVRVTATNRGAVAIGTNGADTGAFLGKVIVGGLEYYGGGLIGTTLADTVHCDQGEFADCMLRYAGGVGGALTLVVNGRSTSTVATANITGTVAELGRLLVAGSCFGGLISDAMIDSRAISDAEYDAWRFGLEVATAPRRWWSGENPGYGTTVTEEIGKTADVMTGAVWDPSAPFKRARIVEDVAACPLFPTAALLTIPSSADLDVGSGSFGIGLWRRLGNPTGANRELAKRYGAKGWLFYVHPTFGVSFYLYDGAVGCSASAYRSYPDDWCSSWLVVDRTLGLVFLYVDARCLTSTAIGALGDITATGTTMRFGTGFTGTMNDGIFIRRAPSPNEIEAHHFEGVPPAEAGATRILWPMREPSGLVVASHPPGYDGLLSADSRTTATRCHARTAA